MIIHAAILTLLIVLIIFIYTWWQQTFSRLYLLLSKIPGPPGYPIIGNLFTFLDSQDNLFKTDRELAKKYYPIYREVGLFYGAVNLLHPDDIELVLSNSKHNDKSKLYGFLHSWLRTGLLTSGGAKWHNRRKILTPAFHFNVLQQFVTIFNEETAKLVQGLKQQCGTEAIDVLSPITLFTLLSIGETSMGIKLDAVPEDCNAYKKAIHTFGNTFTYRMTRPWLYSDFVFGLTKTGKLAQKAIDVLHDFSRNIIAERTENFAEHEKTKKRMAMLDLLLSEKNQGADIDDEGIAEEVDTFMFEGHDTTSLAVTYSLMLLANNPDKQEEIYEEIKTVLGNPIAPPTFSDLKNMTLLERCLKECLRLYPSVPFISRQLTEDISTKTGYVIPKNAMANIHIYDLHRNPEFYPEPLKFDPDRFLPENAKGRHPYAYLPFSAGPRNCIGQKFAMLELKAVLCGILGNFILEAEDRPEDIEMIVDLVLRSKNNAIRVKFTPRRIL